MNRIVLTSVYLLLLGGACPAFSANSLKQATNAEEAVSRIEELGGSVRLIVAKGKELEADFQFSGNALADEHLQLLRHLPEIEVLRLKNVAVTDSGLKHLIHLPNLRRLHLDHSKITDNGIKHLKPLAKLEFLSLYGTVVSDDSVDDLSRIPRLRQIFLSQTVFTAEGLSRLSKIAPDLTVCPNPRHEKETLIPMHFDAERERPLGQPARETRLADIGAWYLHRELHPSQWRYRRFACPTVCHRRCRPE